MRLESRRAAGYGCASSSVGLVPFLVPSAERRGGSGGAAGGRLLLLVLLALLRLPLVLRGLARRTPGA